MVYQNMFASDGLGLRQVDFYKPAVPVAQLKYREINIDYHLV